MPSLHPAGRLVPTRNVLGRQIIARCALDGAYLMFHRPGRECGISFTVLSIFRRNKACTWIRTDCSSFSLPPPDPGTPIYLEQCPRLDESTARLLLLLRAKLTRGIRGSLSLSLSLSLSRGGLSVGPNPAPCIR
jgi:hypothetical protein